MSRHYTFAQQACIKKAGLALQEAAPFKPGDRIGVAISGGVDSMVLLKTLLIRQAIVPFKVEIMALHCNPGFDKNAHWRLLAWLAELGVSAHLAAADFGILAHTPANRKGSPCFFCAWHRRKMLFELCSRYGLSHLAFGHTADDLATTFMLNFYRNGSCQGLPIGESFFGGKLRVVRPLLLVEKKYILQAARQWRLPVMENPCPSNGRTARAEMDALLNEINKKLPGARRSAVNALCRAALEKGRQNRS